MKKLSLIILTLTLSISAFARPKVLYGPDNRQDIYQVQNYLHKKLALSTAGMIHYSAFGQGKSPDLKDIHFPETLERGMNVCKHEKFSQQKIAPSCSGFLVGEDIIVTAGHCYLGFNNPYNVCQDFKWVFDFEMKSPTHDPTQNIKKSDIYHCQEILSMGLDENYDFAIIKLDRKVKDRPILKFRESGKIQDSTHLVVIGHPSGLPTKVTSGFVTKNNEPTRFSANLDTFQGNSGSAVFNAKTGMVEGILVMGKTDYVPSDASNPDSCLVANKCDQFARNCTKKDTGPVEFGEAVLRMSAINLELRKALGK